MAIKSISASRLIAFLAASKMNNEEIEEAKIFLSNASLKEILLHINEARSTLLGETPKPITLEANQVLDNTLSADVVTQIERLLIYEAALNKSEAALLISASLKRRNRKLSIPEFNSKDGFRRWLGQVANCVPLGELLHAASAIRHKRVLSQPDDWIDPDLKK